MDKTRYILGNCLRGYCEGQFYTDTEAWAHLSKYFLLVFPSRSGRGVTLFKEEKHYDISQMVQCKNGVTKISREKTLRRKDVLKKCSGTSYYG